MLADKSCSLGIKYFGGGPALRLPNRWNHVCASVDYMEEEAERTIYANGKFNFQVKTAYLKNKWKPGFNLTFGGREIRLSGFHLKGSITDVQVFSRKLNEMEMIDYTTCSKVEANSVHQINTAGSLPK